jgi:L-rhamnonate dehydratase
MSKIAHVEFIPIVGPEQASSDLDGSVETILIRITDDDGRFGIGETDAPAHVIKSYLEMSTAHAWSQNLPELLVGADPLEIASLWQKMYEATFWPGRRGLGIHAISAIDVALHDLVGKQLGVPTYKIMGGARRERLRPYCTIFPGLAHGRPVADLMTEIERQFDAALSTGFTALKMEVLFYDLVTDRELIELIHRGRRYLGDDILLALDFGYRWDSWHDAKWVLDRVEDCNIYFAEATLQHDDMAGHARLASQSSIRICGAEAAATRWEVREWIERGGVSVVQPNITRCGGLTEIRRISDMCEMAGVQVIPHGWKTGITSAVGRHFQAACQAAPVFEYISPEVFDSPLRRELVSPEPQITKGFMELPTEPGLGITLNEDAVSQWRVDGGNSK